MKSSTLLSGSYTRKKKNEKMGNSLSVAEHSDGGVLGQQASELALEASNAAKSFVATRKSDTTIIKYQDRYIVKTKVKPYAITRDVEVRVPIVEFRPNPKTWMDKAKDVLLILVITLLLFILATRYVTRWLR
jgi:hypothetical protein